MATKSRSNEIGCPLLTDQEACNHLRIRQRQLYSWRMQGVITYSRSGHEMIELKLKTSAGSILYDFLVFIPNAFWKIDSFRAATGEVVTSAEEVEITGDDLIGRTGSARLIVEEYGGRRRNKVAAWITPKPGGNSAAKPAAQTKSAHHASNPI